MGKIRAAWRAWLDFNLDSMLKRGLIENTVLTVEREQSYIEIGAKYSRQESLSAQT